MPDLRRRFLAEHAPDQIGRCRECRNGSTPASEWPCLPYRIALEAQRIADGGAPQVPMQVVSHMSSGSTTGSNPVYDTGRRLKAVPAASWTPRW